jgi:hypothetical protein
LLLEEGTTAHPSTTSAPAKSADAPTTELTPSKALKTGQFWVLWIIFGTTVGGDIMVR